MQIETEQLSYQLLRRKNDVAELILSILGESKRHVYDSAITSWWQMSLPTASREMNILLEDKFCWYIRFTDQTRIEEFQGVLNKCK